MSLLNRNLISFPFGFIFVFFGMIGPSAAQTDDNLLRGFSKIKLLVESLDSNSTTCGLTRDIIRNAVRYPASSAKFQLTEPDTKLQIKGPRTDGTLYINVLSLFFKSTGLYVSRILVEAYSIQTLTLNFLHREAIVQVMLWDQHSMVSTDRAEHAHHVTEAIEELVKQFVTDWNLDNKEGN